ncbi:nucleotide exchange factor GrpE [Mycobacterium hodleri]|uniref:nucleotide exchange factor GrpE n=1 Tax=Mycolicibacterium hodleri TaxID=49897 RepID=UPI0021F305F5|nr:nucleotide exchange factor GrpE [Mycolicibacterium hodleri]MCV7133524.1 nucleotide exchange factor GrpE [Mycolicibacterium hodleri]
MTQENDPHEPVTITDKRRVDPDTGAVRENADSASAPSGSTPDPAPETDEAAELKATLQRVKAEYDNYRKRSVRQEQSASERGKAFAATQLLPVLDDLERARRHGDLESGPLKSVADKLTAALQAIGLVPFGVEGDPFDPSLHEAVQHDGDGSNPVIGTVMRQGYRLGDGPVLRHAMVGVVDSVDVPDTNDVSNAHNAPNGNENSQSDH